MKAISKKWIHVIIFCFASISCNFNSNDLNKDSANSPKIIISELRKIGFFENFSSLTDEEVFDTLHQQRINHYTKIFGRHYDPGMNLSDYEILMLDNKRVVSGDYEADVGKDNDVYIAILETFSRASGGLFNPENIVEKWESDEGPVTVSFHNYNNTVEFKPEYQDDWLSGKVFSIINEQMAIKGNEKFYLFLGKDEFGLGQNFIYVRMSEIQKDAFQKHFGWKFL